MTLIAAAAFAYHAHRLRRYELQRRAEEMIQSMSGSVEISRRPPAWWQRLAGPAYTTYNETHVTFIRPFGLGGSPEDAPQPYVQELRLALKGDAQAMSLRAALLEALGDAKLAVLAKHLPNLPQLKRLVLSQAFYDGTEEVFWIGEWHVADYAEYLRQRPPWADTEITNQGLSHLSRLTDLDELLIHGSRITDEGLEHLRGLTNLKRLWIVNTSVSQAGVQRLRAALPNCEITVMEREDDELPGRWKALRQSSPVGVRYIERPGECQ
ncbi:MAG: hypothetical protein H8E44_10780 [Planctomycetes bacterium]|nr:hypothetical protein [Planctomycetota bacterium]